MDNASEGTLMKLYSKMTRFTEGVARPFIKQITEGI